MIPHFAHVTRSVGENEGVEITMNCNEEAFDWIIEMVKLASNYHLESDIDFQPLNEAQIKEGVDGLFKKLNDENCLNKLVTCHFLHVNWIYERIWDEYF